MVTPDPCIPPIHVPGVGENIEDAIAYRHFVPHCFTNAETEVCVLARNIHTALLSLAKSWIEAVKGGREAGINAVYQAEQLDLPNVIPAPRPPHLNNNIGIKLFDSPGFEGLAIVKLNPFDSVDVEFPLQEVLRSDVAVAILPPPALNRKISVVAGLLLGPDPIH